jgi:pyruvate kinase
VKAKAIIVCSETGATAQQVAKFRPGRPVTVLTTSATVARQCFGYLKGCDSRLLPSLEATDTVVSETIEFFVKTGVANPGDPIVVVHGTSSRSGATNVMRIQYA